MNKVEYTFPSVGKVAKEILDKADDYSGIIAVLEAVDENGQKSFHSLGYNIESDTAVFILLRMVLSLLTESAQQRTVQ